jgi:hypothetical protein
MDDLIKSLQGEISRLNTELAQVRAEARKHRLSKKQLSEQLTGIKGDHEKALQDRDSLKTRLEAAPSDLQKELDRLRGEIRTRDHKSAFERLARDHKVRPEALSDLWQLSGIKAETDTVDEAALQEAIQAAVEARPYLVVQESTPSPQSRQETSRPLQAGPGYGRGTQPGRFHVSGENLSDPAWMFVNQDRLAAAQADGSLVLNGRA